MLARVYCTAPIALARFPQTTVWAVGAAGPHTTVAPYEASGEIKSAEVRLARLLVSRIRA